MPLVHRKKEHAEGSQSFSSRISTSKDSVIQCRISTNYEQPRQSVVESQRIKTYWKSRAASNFSCIFLEMDPCLGRATKKSLQPKSGRSDGYKLHLLIVQLRVQR